MKKAVIRETSHLGCVVVRAREAYPTGRPHGAVKDIHQLRRVSRIHHTQNGTPDQKMGEPTVHTYIEPIGFALRVQSITQCCPVLVEPVNLQASAHSDDALRVVVQIPAVEAAEP